MMKSQGLEGKIVVCVRTLNEEHNIARFCAGYDWADRVLVADGGSTDNTLHIANLFDNVWTREFSERVAVGDGWMNPEPQHINFLLDWALAEGADWIIFDDCDCWPNPALKRDARRILESAKEPAVHLNRLYLWGKDQYMPKYNVSDTIWAWQPALQTVRWPETSPFIFAVQVEGIDPERALHLDAPPYCCLHNFAPDEAIVQRKLSRYAAWGFPQVHPLESCYTPPAPLPEWVYAVSSTEGRGDATA